MHGQQNIKININLCCHFRFPPESKKKKNFSYFGDHVRPSVRDLVPTAEASHTIIIPTNALT